MHRQSGITRLLTVILTYMFTVILTYLTCLVLPTLYVSLPLVLAVLSHTFNISQLSAAYIQRFLSVSYGYCPYSTFAVTIFI